MLKEAETVSGGCNTGSARPRRYFPRFSLRRLLYSSPLIGRRIVRTPSSSNRNAKGIKNLNISILIVKNQIINFYFFHA